MLFGLCLFSIYLGILSIGPGRYNANTAIKSSMFFGTSFINTSVIPELSNWKTPRVFPLANIEYTSISSIGMLSILKVGLSFLM